MNRDTRLSPRPYVIAWTLFGLGFGIATGLMVLMETGSVWAFLAQAAGCLVLAAIGGTIKYRYDRNSY